MLQKSIGVYKIFCVGVHLCECVCVCVCMHVRLYTCLIEEYNNSEVTRTKRIVYFFCFFTSEYGLSEQSR
uniref:Putative secreted protein n=1 Tax=Ixodes ricinus TaxID=34613 RepID=A0A6B0U1B1_IXORI